MDQVDARGVDGRGASRRSRRVAKLCKGNIHSVDGAGSQPFGRMVGFTNHQTRATAAGTGRP